MLIRVVKRHISAFSLFVYHHINRGLKATAVIWDVCKVTSNECYALQWNALINHLISHYCARSMLMMSVFMRLLLVYFINCSKAQCFMINMPKSVIKKHCVDLKKHCVDLKILF